MSPLPTSSFCVTPVCFTVRVWARTSPQDEVWRTTFHWWPNTSGILLHPITKWREGCGTRCISPWMPWCLAWPPSLSIHPPPPQMLTMNLKNGTTDRLWNKSYSNDVSNAWKLEYRSGKMRSFNWFILRTCHGRPYPFTPIGNDATNHWCLTKIWW